MSRLAAVSTFPAVLALALAPVAARASDASAESIAELDSDIAGLEQEIDALEPGDARAERFRQRAEELREEAVFLKVKMRRHRDAGGSGTGVNESELAEVRRRFGDLRADLDAAFGRRADSELVLPAGTALLVSLDDPISSRNARIEDRVSCRVVQDVRAEGRVAIPAETQVRGIVRGVRAAERPSKAGQLELSFDALYLDGLRYDIDARVAQFEEGSGAGRKAGIGAVVGAVVGGLLGGKDGAVAGILIGGGGAVVASKGEDVELPAGTVLTIRLDRELALPR